VVVDPLRTRIAEHADLHIAPLPGTDVLLGFALALELEALGAHDRAFIAEHVAGYEAYMAAAREWPLARAAAAAAVPEEALRTLARWLAEASPLVLAPGNGLERGRNGGAGIRAVVALPALLGKLDAQSGIVLGNGNSFPRNPAFTRPDLAPPGTRVMNILDVGRHLVEDDIAPPLRALVIYNHNPIAVHPDQNRMRRGLAREEVFTLGIELTMTESMRYCDLVLPAAASFEIHDLYPSYGHQWLQRAEPVLPPPAEALPNTEIFRRLAARFGFAEDCFRDDDHALMRDAMLLDALPAPDAPQRMARQALFVTHGPATPSGKVELMSDTLAKRWGEEARLPRFHPRRAGPALTLISPASDRRISSTLLGAAPGEAPPLLMHPEDAAARGLGAAARVRVHNALGSVVLPLRVTDAVPPGVVASEKGAWGPSISALASADDRADLAAGACYNDTQVEVAEA
jgi:anaerobic selenocysteine-containing dehydrogenase